MKKQKESKLLKSRVAIVLVILVLIIIAIKNAIYGVILKNQIENTRLLLNNEIISLKDEIYIDDDKIYISEDDIQVIFDPTIYYNVGDKELITTYNKHVAVLHLDEKEMQVNDISVPMESALKEVDSKIYLPIKELENVYDMEVYYSKDSNILIMNSTTKAKNRVMALDDMKVKATRLPFSATIEKISRGDYLYVVEQKKRFQKVRTENGNIGYVKTRNVSDIEVLRDDLEEENAEIHLLEDYSDYTQKYDKPNLEENKQNVVIMDAFETAKDKSIVNKIDIQSEDYQNYLKWADENDITIIGNYKNGLTVSTNLATYGQRNELIKELYLQVMTNQYKGICLEFDEIDDINSFYRFLIEITPKFKESGLKVLVKLNDKMDKKKVKKLVDFCF